MKIGILGGSGMNDPKLLQDVVRKTVSTPYGEPSGELLVGQISGIDCVFIPRHGPKHTISPTNVNYRANLWALKEEGCKVVIACTACGGLQEYTKPGDFIILDQFIDRTRLRQQTFYDGDPLHCQGVLHIPMNEPFCEEMRRILFQASLECGGAVVKDKQDIKNCNFRVHERGCVVTIEGPRFSSRAESLGFHSIGADVINMTTVPEVVLAKELGMSYAAIAMVTDYDSWHPVVESVSVEKVLQTFRKNAEIMKKIFARAVVLVAKKDWSNILDDYAKIVKGARQDLA